MNTKKQIERQYLDILRGGVDDFPNGAITSTERPDFLIRSAERVVGVEITRIFNRGDPGSRPPQSQDSERDLIAERAQSMAEERSIPPVMTDIYFESHQLIGKRDRDGIAECLVDFVAANMPPLGDHRSIENRHPMTSRFPSQVAAVSIWRFKSLTSHLWQTGDAGIVNENFAPYLQNLIDDKNGKVPAYHTKCDKCWLLIVADWRGPSAFFEISDTMAGDSYHTAFDRVYFVEGFSGRVVALNTHEDAR